MEDIFASKNLYPYSGKIKEHFKSSFDSIFIVFLPFFKVEKKVTVANENNKKKSEKLTLEEAVEKNPLFRKLDPNIDSIREIYIYDNEDYPTPLEIFRSAQIISWETIIKGSGLKTASQLNKALQSSIGALNKLFQKPAFTARLEKYTTEQSIWHPTEGCYDVLSKIAIYKTFKLLGKNEIVVMDEFYETSTIYYLNELSDFEFSERLGGKDHYLYSTDKEILFAIEWDSFFFLIATDEKKMKLISRENTFEGFLCDERTEHNWGFKEGEIEKN